jgi:hypothetical protein
MAITTITFGTNHRSERLALLLLAAYFKYGVPGGARPTNNPIVGADAMLSRGVEYVANSVKVRATVGIPLVIDLSADEGGWNSIDEGAGMGQIFCVPLMVVNANTGARISADVCSYIPLRWIQTALWLNGATLQTEPIP